MASFDFIFCDTYEDDSLEYLKNKCKESKDLKKNILIFFDVTNKLCYIESGLFVFTIYDNSGMKQIVFTEFIFINDSRKSLFEKYSINAKDIFSYFPYIAHLNQDVFDWLIFNIDLWNSSKSK